MHEGDRRHAHRTAFFTWYITAHRHSGRGLHTPADVRFSVAPARRDARVSVFAAACVRTSERFVRHRPQSRWRRESIPLNASFRRRVLL